MTTVRNFPCILCEKRTKPQERRFLSGDNNKPLRKYPFKTFFVSVHDGDVLCGKCRRVYYTDCNQKLECTSYISSTSTDNHDTEYQPTSSKLQRRSEPTLLSPRNITLPLASIGGSHSTCFVCKKRGPKLIVASASVRFNCFLYNNIIVPAGSRCCPSHVNDDDLLTRQYI